MNVSWHPTKLAKVLTPASRAEAVDPTKEYPLLGVRLEGRGPFLRETVMGSQSAATKLFKVEQGDFIYSRLFAWRGAFGVIGPELDGCYVSGEFPTFHPVPGKIDAKFLRLWFRLPSTIEKVEADCTGSTPLTRNRFKENFFLDLEISLPPLPEQQRIVARIEALSAKIEEARGLRQQTDEETGVLATRACSQILDNPRWEFKRLEFVLAETPRNGLSPQRETETNGRPMLRINAVSSTPSRFVDMSAYKNVDVSEDVASQFVLQQDDVFIVRYNGDINRVAKAAIFKGEKGTKVVYPDKLMRLRTDMKKMLPDFLVFALGSRTVRGQIEELGKTTAGQIGVSGADAKSFVVPVPPVEEQRHIVAYLDRLQAKVDALKKLQSDTAGELAALLPSILDKAFKGRVSSIRM
jgi:type I restriction enzyme S subunit